MSVEHLKRQFKDSLPVAMLAGGVITFVPAIFLFYLCVLTGWLLGGPPPVGDYTGLTPALVTSVLVLAPIIETTLLSLFLIVLHRFFSRPVPVAILAGLLAAYFHYDTKGIYPLPAIAWEFFVFSALFLHWWRRSYWQAWLAAAAPHYLLNLWALALQLLYVRLIEG